MVPDPVLLNLFFLVIPFQVVLVIQALRETARQGAEYVPQIGSGLAISSIGAMLIFGGSIVFTTVAFPNYFEELRAAQEVGMRQVGVDEARIAEALAEAERSFTPVNQAIQGFIGTVLTGLVTAAIAGRWIRYRPERAAA